LGLWSYTQVDPTENDKVLIVISPTYSLVYEDKLKPGEGLGSAIEAQRIFDQLYGQRGENPRFRVVVLQEGDDEGIPDHIKKYHRFRPHKTPEDLDKLINWLGGSPPAKKKAARARRRLLPVSPKPIPREDFINCANAFLAFQQLLGPDSVALLDFKGHGRNPAACLRSIADSLELAPPGPADSELDIQARALLDARKDRPAILFFDAFEHAEKHHNDWIHPILERVDRDPLLRCVFAGRKTPDWEDRPWRRRTAVSHCDLFEDRDAIIAYARQNDYEDDEADIHLIIDTFVDLREQGVDVSPKNLLARFRPKGGAVV
jgi:hypothetical protein